MQIRIRKEIGMDLLQELQKKIVTLDGHPRFEGLKAAIRHVEVAERYLGRARHHDDPDAYNDVVYRTNQAFEGMLKEAYAVFSEKDTGKLSPFQIEEKLLKENKLTSRVLSLFKNYRQDWRNAATHDHTLLFSDQEALLAIVSVAAFAVVLLDQVTEMITYQRELEAVESRRDAIRKEMAGYAKLPFEEQIIALLERFSGELDRGQMAIRSEVELLGHLNGFISAVDPEIHVVRDALLGDSRYRGDLILEKSGLKALIEVKAGVFPQRYLDAAMGQVSSYLGASGIETGILYVAPISTKHEVEARKLSSGFGSKQIWIVAPRVNEGGKVA